METKEKRVAGNSGKKQQEIMLYIQNYLLVHGYSPTVREIGKAVSLKSTASVQRYLDEMDEQGLIHKGSKPRTLTIMDEHYSLPVDPGVPIPVVREIQLGDDMFNRENISSYVSVPRWFVRDGFAYVFYQVKDPVEEGGGVQVGDYVLVRLDSSVKQGVLSVIRKNGRLTAEKGHLRFVRLGAAAEAYLRRIEGSVLGEAVGFFHCV